MDQKILEQVISSIREADLICFVVSARDGLVNEDFNVADIIRIYKKNVLVIVNKIDGLDPVLEKVDFYSLGFSEIHAVSATNGIGITILIQKYFLNLLKLNTSNYDERKSLFFSIFEREKGKTRLEKNVNFIKIAVIGKPNVGKSTLINNILNENRMIVDDYPGTTRDSIWNVITYENKNYVFIDTAGIRRKNKISNYVEKFSIEKSLHSIKLANVVILMLDATDVISNQDLFLFNYIIDSGCGVVILFNKCDKISQYDKRKLVSLERLKIMKIGVVHFISAINGLGVKKIFELIDKIFQNSIKKLNTSRLTEIMNLAVEKYQPPMIRGVRIKLKYAHLGDQNPLKIIVHGNKLNHLSSNYKQYLSNYFIKTLKLVGNPIHFYFKNNKNPFLK
ncbi:MAG: ribosome biogenesis GTPase Der [Buchnera aphidicola (Floraphis meitanensis)]